MRRPERERGRRTKGSLPVCVEYIGAHFTDPDYGEWYGYLRRDGLPTQPAAKGSTFKGPFHVPRSLIIADKLMNEIEAKHG